MSEFLTIQVGQCGNQIGYSFWPSVLEEYGIHNMNYNNKSTQNSDLQSSIHSFFTVPSSKACSSLNTLDDLKRGHVKARAILVDMEESVVARFKTAPFRDIFDDKCLITSYPGSGNNWAQGFFYHGPRYEDKILTAVRRAAEQCDSLQGFILLFSVGGGTGSGMGSYILQLLADNFPNIERLVSCVYPTGSEDVITCPYNMALATECLTESATCVFPVENRALLDIVTRQYSTKIAGEKSRSIVEFKPFHDMNSNVVRMLLHLTSGSRFSGDLNVDINEINTNMVPFPKLHFLASSFGPNVPLSSNKIINQPNSYQMKEDIFRNACSKNSQLLKIDPLGLQSLLLGTTLIGRGDFCVSDMRNCVKHLHSKAHFTPWSRKSIKTGLCSVPSVNHSASMLCLFNTTAISTLFAHLLMVHKKLYKKKAHVHHYTEVSGFDIDCFESCKNSLLSNVESYKEIESRL